MTAVWPHAAMPGEGASPSQKSRVSELPVPSTTAMAVSSALEPSLSRRAHRRHVRLARHAVGTALPAMLRRPLRSTRNIEAHKRERQDADDIDLEIGATVAVDVALHRVEVVQCVIGDDEFAPRPAETRVGRHGEVLVAGQIGTGIDVRQVDVVCDSLEVHDRVAVERQTVLRREEHEMVRTWPTPKGILPAVALQVVVAVITRERIVAGTAQKVVADVDEQGAVFIAAVEVVVPAAAFQMVFSVAAVEIVTIVLPIQPVVAAIAPQRVVADAAMEVVAISDLVAAVELVDAAAAGEMVPSGTAGQMIVVAVAKQPIVAAITRERVVAGAAMDNVALSNLVAAMKLVITGFAGESILVLVAPELIIAGTAVQVVAAGAAVDGVVASLAIEPVPAVLAVDGVADPAAMHNVVAAARMEVHESGGRVGVGPVIEVDVQADQRIGRDQRHGRIGDLQNHVTLSSIRPCRGTGT